MRLKNYLFSIFVITLLSSCQQETLEIPKDDGIDLSYDTSAYDQSSFGEYKGIFSTRDSEIRGTVAISIKPNVLPSATLFLNNGEKLELLADQIVYSERILTNLLFTNANIVAKNSTSFTFSVRNDGKNPMVNTVFLNRKPSGIVVLKETSFAPVVPITGSYYCDDCGSHPTLGNGESQTFNIAFGGDATGDDTEIVTQIFLGENDYGTASNNAQSNCLPDGDFVNCDILGASETVGGAAIVYSGVHKYSTVADCSQINGTWTFNSSVYGMLSGVFVSDTACAPPINDLCEDALPLTCGTSVAVNMATSTNSGNPTTSCITQPGTNSGVWYTYTDSGSPERIRIDTNGSNFDTKLNVYTGSCDALTCVTGDDDGGDTNRSLVTFDTTGDGSSVYTVLATRFSSGVGGKLLLNITCGDVPPPALGDVFEEAIPFTPSESGVGCSTDTFTVDLSGAGETDSYSDSGLNPSCTSTVGQDIFYTWTATETSLIWNTGANSPGIAIYSADGTTQYGCNSTFSSSAILEGWSMNEDLVIQIFDGSSADAIIGFCLEVNPPLILTCGDQLIDDGGASGNYPSSASTSYLIDAGSGQFATVSFSQFELEQSYDYMRIYDGNDANTAPEITTSVGGATTTSANGNSGFTGTSLEGDSVVSSGQFLTVVFESDSSVTEAGYVAAITCESGRPLMVGAQKARMSHERTTIIGKTRDQIHTERLEKEAVRAAESQRKKE